MKARHVFLGLGTLAAGLAAALTLSEAAAGATQTFAPSADAFVYGTNPDTNYGSDTALRVDGSPCCMRSYLQFDLTGLSGTVTSATLHVYANSTQSTGYDAHAVSNSWSEGSITYANAPAFGAAVGSSGPVVGGTWTQVDVTSLVTGNDTISIGLATTSLTQLSLSSREGAHPPYLTVTTTGGTPPGPCGTKVGQTSTITKVMWILMENKDYSSIYGNSAAPYETQLADECGLATNYHAIAHPSLPNYIALTSGSTHGISDDGGPSSHPLDVPSIFGQAYPSAVGYDESMPSNCYLSDSGSYAVRHNPWAYYVDGSAGDQRTECQSNDVPLGSVTGGDLYDDVQAGTLPAFSFVTPNLCDDMHDCSVATGDAYLQQLVPMILSGPDYQNGELAVVIVFDENSGTSGNQVYAAVVSPFTSPGTQDGTDFTHYSLLRTTEEILGLPLLGNAATANDMRPAFGL